MNSRLTWSVVDLVPVIPAVWNKFAGRQHLQLKEVINLILERVVRLLDNVASFDTNSRRLQSDVLIHVANSR